jgi:hypothetical protein
MNAINNQRARFQVGDRVRVKLPSPGVVAGYYYTIVDVVFHCSFTGAQSYVYVLDEFPQQRWRDDHLEPEDAVAWEQPRLL